ncbi:MAG: hypothetical protein U5K29_00800 [Acidimicrobiales bacterium]|nr:hypothetical protein [Acidimicrobiales bacterium]
MMDCNCTFTTTALARRDPDEVKALHDRLIRCLSGDEGVGGIAEALDHLASGHERSTVVLDVADLVEFVSEHRWPDQVATLRLARAVDGLTRRSVGAD